MHRREFLKLAPGGLLAASEMHRSPAFLTRGVHISIDGSKVVGAATVIGDLIGSQYEPYTFGFRNPDQWGIDAWREIGFNISDIALFNFEGSNPYTVSGKIVGIHVSRSADGKLHLDFTDFDKNIRFMREELGVKKIDFTVWGTPKALASKQLANDFYFYAPADYKEWSEVVRSAVAHIKNDLGLAGSSYKPWTEPDSGFYWRGRLENRTPAEQDPNPDKQRIARSQDVRMLHDYVEKYVVDWHAIKTIDPDAKVGGPFTCWSTDVKGGPLWSLDEFLTEIENYNRSNPEAAVTVDELVYQDYNWYGNGLSEGVIAANKVVSKHGLPETIPLVLAGWNNGMKNDQTLQQRAAYITANIIGELAPVGRKRTLSRAYIWPFDYDYYAEGLGPVAMPFTAVSYSGDDGSDGVLANPAVAGYHKRPLHAALKLLSQMKPGQLIAARSDSSDVAVLATLQPDHKIMCILANNSREGCSVIPNLSHLPFGRSARLKVQRVDATHSSDGLGLEKGDHGMVHITAGGGVPPLFVSPFSVTGITIETN